MIKFNQKYLYLSDMIWNFFEKSWRLEYLKEMLELTKFVYHLMIKNIQLKQTCQSESIKTYNIKSLCLARVIATYNKRRSSWYFQMRINMAPMKDILKNKGQQCYLHGKTYLNWVSVFHCNAPRFMQERNLWFIGLGTLKYKMYCHLKSKNEKVYPKTYQRNRPSKLQIKMKIQ